MILYAEGKMINYKGSRNQNALLEFATNGYKEKIDGAVGMEPRKFGFDKIYQDMRRDFFNHFRAGIRHVKKDAKKYGLD